MKNVRASSLSSTPGATLLTLSHTQTHGETRKLVDLNTSSQETTAAYTVADPPYLSSQVWRSSRENSSSTIAFAFFLLTVEKCWMAASIWFEISKINIRSNYSTDRRQTCRKFVRMIFPSFLSLARIEHAVTLVDHLPSNRVWNLRNSNDWSTSR